MREKILANAILQPIIRYRVRRDWEIIDTASITNQINLMKRPRSCRLGAGVLMGHKFAFAGPLNCLLFAGLSQKNMYYTICVNWDDYGLRLLFSFIKNLQVRKANKNRATEKKRAARAYRGVTTLLVTAGRAMFSRDAGIERCFAVAAAVTMPDRSQQLARVFCVNKKLCCFAVLFRAERNTLLFVNRFISS